MANELNSVLELPKNLLDTIRIGTCSWNYPEWKETGLYSNTYKMHFEYLTEYSKYFNTAEIDQWFWSLMDNDIIRMPKFGDVRAYNELTPNDFVFTAKAPNSITLTHYYKSNKLNANFLSLKILEKFLTAVQPLGKKLGVIMFEFEYLNKNKIASQDKFFESLEKFFRNLPKRYNFAVETRNPNFLKPNFFELLKRYNIGLVLMDGYYMPPVENTFEVYKNYLTQNVVLRLLGKDRIEIEKKTGKSWTKIVEPRDETIEKVVKIILDLSKRKIPIFTNINNHFEGSAPLTAQKIINALKSVQ
jgi:uncharacterized protein YecE (DUF72 family)